MGKHWRPEEIALICKAYTDVIRNPIHGADQRLADFFVNLLEKYKTVSPTNCDDGRYYLRGDSVYPHLRDYVFPDVQKFQKAIRIVDASNPSGTTEKENLNMAIAIHTKATKKMEYKFKDFDSSKWKLYESYIELKKLPKFFKSPSTSSVITQDIESESSVSTHESSRGGGRGRNAAVLAKNGEQKESRKRAREEERDKKFEGMVSNMAEICTIMKNKSASMILAKAIKATTDAEKKKILEDKLIKMALEL